MSMMEVDFNEDMEGRVELACLYTAASDLIYGALKSAAHKCWSAPKSCLRKS